jgi:hypothetical protein
VLHRVSRCAAEHLQNDGPPLDLFQARSHASRRWFGARFHGASRRQKMPTHNTLVVGVSIPATLPNPASPQDFAELLIESRHTLSVGVSHLTDPEVRELVAVAFFASLVSEEGRFPSGLTLFVGVNEDVPKRDAAFSRSEPLSVEALRKVSPAIPHSHALRLGRRDGRLHIVAFSRNLLLTDRLDDRPEFWLIGGQEAGLWLTINGPADLTVSEAGPELRYVGGRVRHCVPISSAPGISLVAGLSARIAIKQLQALHPEAGERYGCAASYGTMLNSLLAQSITQMRRARHGGTILVMPEDAGGLVKFKHQFAEPMRFGTSAKDYWLAWLDAKPPQVINFYRLEMLNAARVVAALANVDGCVGLTNAYDVAGFGGEIQAMEAQLPFVDAATGVPWTDQSGESLGGTRHRSALRFCRSAIGALAVVVSQDGGISVFHSGNTGVTCYRGFDAVQSW